MKANARINEIVNNTEFDYRDSCGAYNFEDQYNEMINVLKVYGISLEGIPQFKDLKFNRINISTMLRPTLIIVPPLTRQELILAIDNQEEIGDLEYNCYTLDFDNDELWGRNSEEWQVQIVEGIKDIEEKKYGDAGDQRNEWIKKFTKENLEPINTNTYIILMMMTLGKNGSIDQKYVTFLGKSKSYIAFAGFDFSCLRVRFSAYLPENKGNWLRGRPSVRIF